MALKKTSIKTPHAAVLVWNYVDRISAPTDTKHDATGVADQSKMFDIEKGDIENPLPVIISTLSCVSIQTSKSKSQPQGNFNLVLAPYKNWISNLTVGSWCCLLMSNEPITESDLKKANRKKVKMLGRIDSVRCQTTVGDDGARQTLYYISGTDWGDIFNSTLYVDNLIKDPQDKGNNQGDKFALAMRPLLMDGETYMTKTSLVAENLRGILKIFGKRSSSEKISRLGTSVYEFKLPPAVRSYFNFVDSEKKGLKGESLNELLSVIVGSLVDNDKYEDRKEAKGVMDPFSLQGTHTLWQILMENSNPALNEMLCDLKWHDDNSVEFRFYNRIKPFGYQKNSNNWPVRSLFKHVNTHKIIDSEVISVNAGNNWRDKINFIEIKPQHQDMYTQGNLIKQKSQVFDEVAFEREGFRSMILNTKQFPWVEGQGSAEGNASNAGSGGIPWQQLENWTKLAREWYFDTHRMLNGTITIHGTTNYIGIGDNIRFDAGLINPTPNINSASYKKNQNYYILAHVESVQHQFSVKEGARSYTTNIQFVRGIVVSDKNEVIGNGTLDQFATDVTQAGDRNTKNVISTSSVTDPDPQKIRGT